MGIRLKVRKIQNTENSQSENKMNFMCFMQNFEQFPALDESIETENKSIWHSSIPAFEHFRLCTVQISKH